MGLSKDIAQSFAVQTVYGAGKMLAKTGAPAQQLKEKVKSPNGTTEAALKYFESQNLYEIIKTAMKEAEKRSKELSK